MKDRDTKGPMYIPVSVVPLFTESGTEQRNKIAEAWFFAGAKQKY
jgi:hypothetical protein